MSSSSCMRVHVQGAGKVGKVLASRWKQAGWPVSLRAARRGPPSGLKADVVVLAVRDGQLRSEAQRWREASATPTEAVVLHVAGALDAEMLGELRPCCRGVGQMHPLVSFASSRAAPALEGAYALISGDRRAVRAAKRLAGALGMRTRSGEGVDLTAYHAAAWLVAGGTAALGFAARDILLQAGIDHREAEHMLAPLIRSVGDNVGRIGLPEALTGVVRRGDVATLKKHATVLGARSNEHLRLYLACAMAQLPMARGLNDAPGDALDALQAELMSQWTALSGPDTLQWERK